MEHAGEHYGAGQAGSRKGLVLVVALAAVTIILGLAGFWLHGPTGAACEHPGQWWFLDPLYRTIALFEFAEANLQIPICYPDRWELAIARFTGPAATLLFLWQVLRELLRGPIDRLRLGLFTGHTVIIGFGEQGQVRALEAAASGARVAALEKAPSEALEAIARRHGVVLAGGDARNPGTLRRVRIEWASDIVIATGDDAQNLLIAQAVAARLKQLPGPAPRIDVSLADPLLRRALDPKSAESLIDVFSVEDMAAYLLCAAARLPEIADLAGQRRLHVVMLGFGRLGASLLAQILRSGATAGLERTMITILTQDAGAAAKQLRLSYPGAEAVAQVSIIAAEPLHAALDQGELMREIEAAAPVTAVLALGNRSADTFPLALAIREAARRSGCWRAPIFFGIEHATSLAELSCPIDAAKRYAQVLHPFEVSAHLCTRQAGAARDAVAAAIHAAYLEDFERLRREGVKPSTADEALVPWPRLKPTFRQANRRAADHVAAKLWSVGCVVPDGPPHVPARFDLLQDPGALERLADLEHQAWAIDRQLEGWRPGPVRDNARRIHDCLVPYDALPEPTKVLDRAQVRELAASGLRRVDADAAAARPARLVRFDLWVALIGSRALGADAAAWLAETLAERVLPPLLDAHPEHNITLLSPLAPGADLIATTAALRLLAARGRQHRLLVVEAVSPRQVVDDFEASWKDGAVGDRNLAGPGRVWAEARDALLAAIGAVESSAACERVIELDPVDAGAGAAERQAGYRRQNAYLVQRAHVVIAALEPSGTVLPGGTGEAIAWRRDRATLPASMPRYAPRPNAAAGAPGLVLIDLARRAVSEETAGA